MPRFLAGLLSIYFTILATRDVSRERVCLAFGGVIAGHFFRTADSLNDDMETIHERPYETTELACPQETV